MLSSGSNLVRIKQDNMTDFSLKPKKQRRDSHAVIWGKSFQATEETSAQALRQ